MRGIAARERQKKFTGIREEKESALPCMGAAAGQDCGAAAQGMRPLPRAAALSIVGL